MRKGVDWRSAGTARRRGVVRWRERASMVGVWEGEVRRERKGEHIDGFNFVSFRRKIHFNLDSLLHLITAGWSPSSTL